MMNWGWNGQTGISTGNVPQALRSRLVAIDLKEGKLSWERGDPQKDSCEITIDSYFLGPPLPVDGKLYVLIDKNSELRLVCLDARRGEPLWARTLATTKDKMLLDPSRRAQAAHLAYADGILVCPTSAGAIFGVDLLTRCPIWVFPYRERPKTNQPENPNPMPGMVRFGGGSQQWGANLQKFGETWKMSSPIIVDGKVIITAADGEGIHCLNLYDGESLWKAPRGKGDIYVAGVFGGKVIVVGKNNCRAISLEDGKKQVWEAATGGVPTGQGVICGSHYYLPIRRANAKYEVCKVNLETGKVDGISPAPDNEAPGNLLFYETPGNSGDSVVISQNEKASPAISRSMPALPRSMTGSRRIRRRSKPWPIGVRCACMMASWPKQ
jgi:outer membrane protein assembly factor BamB